MGVLEKNAKAGFTWRESEFEVTAPTQSKLDPGFQERKKHLIRSIRYAVSLQAFIKLVYLAGFLFVLAWLIGAFPGTMRSLGEYLRPGGLIDRVMSVIAITLVYVASNHALSASYRQLVKCRQWLRDLNAEETHFLLLYGRSHEPFWLFLRPFKADSWSKTTRIASEGSLGQGNAAQFIYWDTSSELIRKIALGLDEEKIGHSIAVGVHPGLIGPGQILSTEQTWQEDARLLMSRAALIVVVAGSSAGTLREIDEIFAKGYLEKTIFVMPPKFGARLPELSDMSNFGAEEGWPDVARRLGDHGTPAIPLYRPDGMLFALDPSTKSIQYARPIPPRYDDVAIVVRPTLLALNLGRREPDVDRRPYSFEDLSARTAPPPGTF
jgi:hypothetical protein